LTDLAVIFHRAIMLDGFSVNLVASDHSMPYKESALAA
jgi:hypothetical protein